jgi:hypothetical protein
MVKNIGYEAYLQSTFQCLQEQAFALTRTSIVLSYVIANGSTWGILIIAINYHYFTKEITCCV